MDLSNYPESKQKLETQEQATIIGDFLTWLQDHRKVVLCQFGIDADKGEEVLLPTNRTTNQWLADYFGIDLDKLEQERMEILNMLVEKGIE